MFRRLFPILGVSLVILGLVLWLLREVEPANRSPKNPGTTPVREARQLVQIREVYEAPETT